MDHKSWLAYVPADVRRDLTERSDMPGLLRLTVHIGGLVVFGNLIMMGGSLWWLFLAPQAVFVTCLFHLAHEATHQTPFRTGWLNRFAGHFAGFALILPFHWFTAFHLAHHKWTNLPGKDPELDGAKPKSLSEWVLHVSGFFYWVKTTRTLCRLSLGLERPGYLPEKARLRAKREARFMAAGYCIAFLLIPVFPAIFWCWMLPAVIGQPLLRLYLLAEHGDLPQVSNIFENTRTTYTSRLVRWMTWNMPYHTEHHVWPNVPFHKLPEVHDRMKAALRHTATGYRDFNKDYLARRLRPADAPGNPSPE